MKTSLAYVIIIAFYLTSSPVNGQEVYYPGRDWLRKSAAGLGLDQDKLDEAVSFAKNNEYKGSRDLRQAILKGFEREPYHEIAGPTKKRGGPAGIILKDGFIVAEWGDIHRVDMTFSVTKSYLSTVAGLALDHGLIGSVKDPVADYVWDGTFEGEHNSQVNWHHLLNQSSDWSGTLFGIHDWADRPPREGGIDDWKRRELHEPGTHFEYNDVRVNVLAYSLLQVWRKPLPQVLKEEIMDPIGASSGWRWYGYDHSWVTLDGVKMQSVSGGGHSGGGLFINTLDHTRFGLLFLRGGQWGDRQLLSKDWIQQALVSSEANERYGYMWWLNKGENAWKEVHEDVYYAAGFGGNFIVIDRRNDLVVVTRWLEPSQINEMMRRVMKALKPEK